MEAVGTENHVVRQRSFFPGVAAVALAAPPQRIVSTAPSITEMLYALGWAIGSSA